MRSLPGDCLLTQIYLLHFQTLYKNGLQTTMPAFHTRQSDADGLMWDTNMETPFRACWHMLAYVQIDLAFSVSYTK